MSEVNVKRVLIFEKYDGFLDLDTKMVHGGLKIVTTVSLEKMLTEKWFVDLLTDDEVYFLNEEVLK